MACTLGPSPAGRGSREPGAGGGGSVGRGRGRGSSELGFWARKRHGSEVGSKECGDPKECGGEKGRRKEDERREERIESSSNRQGLVPTAYSVRHGSFWTSSCTEE